jgi:hypothetical protein
LDKAQPINHERTASLQTKTKRSIGQRPICRSVYGSKARVWRFVVGAELQVSHAKLDRAVF